MFLSSCTLLVTLLGAAAAASPPCDTTVDITSGATAQNDSSILFDGISYRAGDYFVADDGRTKGCVCAYRTCIRKCCDGDKYIVAEIGGCADGDGPRGKITPTIHHGVEVLDAPSVQPFWIIDVPGHQWCKDQRYKLDPKTETDVFKLQKNGSLFLPNDPSMPLMEPLSFCIEHFEDIGTHTVLACGVEEPDTQGASYGYVTGMMISLPFLLVTFMVYAFIPELRNLHGKCLMCYVMSLFVAYVFLISIQLGRAVISNTFCVVAPFIIYFGFMVSFLWLNVMCIDIWWTFSGRRGFIGSARQSERRRFLVYSAYAWGIAMAMVAITAAMQFADVPVGWIKPEFGVGKCWFAQEKATGLYFYGPIMLVILSNLLLFGWTTMKIYQVKKETERSMRNDSQRHGDESDKQRFKLYMKLMLVFGVNWSMEIISWLAGGPNFLWYVTDLCNALYGVLIFFIFVCKANVWKLTKKRYHSLMGRAYKAHSYAPTSENTRTTGTGVDSFAMATDSTA